MNSLSPTPWHLTILTKAKILIRPIYEGKGHILMFHRVLPGTKYRRISANSDMEITPELLESVIGYFRVCGYSFISINQLKNRLTGSGVKKRFVVFTFDDGYADVLDYAYPLLKKHGVPFTVYIMTDFPDRTAVIWWYLLEDIIRSRSTLEICLDGKKRVFGCTTAQAKEDTFKAVRFLIMKYSTPRDYIPAIQEIFNPFGVDLQQKTRKIALSWDQIRLLNKDPLVTIGAHSVRHFVLSRLTRQDAEREIAGSKAKIEAQLGEDVLHFAYPFGGEGEAGLREAELVKKCGFETAVTTRFASIYGRHRSHLESLPRIYVDPRCDSRFLSQVADGTLPCHRNRFKRVITL